MKAELDKDEKVKLFVCKLCGGTSTSGIALMLHFNALHGVYSRKAHKYIETRFVLPEEVETLGSEPVKRDPVIESSEIMEEPL